MRSNDFLDTTLDVELQSRLAAVCESEVNEGRIIRFVGYRKIVDQSSGTSPFVIAQTQDQARLMGKGVLDGVIHYADDSKININGRIIESGIGKKGLLFAEIDSVLSVAFSSIQSLSWDILDRTNTIGGPQAVYDLALHGELYTGNYYSPPKYRNEEAESIWPSTIGTVRMKDVPAKHDILGKLISD